jgi:hypothetical protein
VIDAESGIKTEDWFAAKRPIKISSIGPGTSLSDVPKLLKAALGLPIDMVEGYKGGAEARLAVENGEVDGSCASWQATKVTWRSQMDSGKIRVVLQATTIASVKAVAILLKAQIYWPRPKRLAHRTFTP